MQNKIATLPSIKIIPPENPLEYLNGSSSTRRWEVTINWKTKVYLTDQEKNYYLEQLKLGKKIIQVGDLILTKRFDSIIPLSKPKVEPLTEEEKESILDEERQRMMKANKVRWNK